MAENPSIMGRIRDYFFPIQEKSLVSPSAEGSWRGPFAGVGELGNYYQLGSLEDGWQKNLDVATRNPRHVATAYGCVMVTARSVSQCYPTHVIKSPNGEIKQVTNTAAFRTLMNPNSYQTTPNFLLNLVAEALFNGESFAVAVRNNRNEVIALHPFPSSSVQIRIDNETGSIFYSVGSNPLMASEIEFIVPARDMLHLRFLTPRHPLIGETPLKAAAMAMGINVSLSQSQAAFFSNMSRPSGILATDQTLNKEQMLRLREAFDAQSKLLAQGGLPILSNGLKFQPFSLSNEDSQLIEAQRMSVEEICRVFGVPPPLVGELSHATLNNSETLIQYFMSISLGSTLEHIERAFDRLFELPNNEYVELDTSALLRSDFAARIEGLTKGVQGGLYTPNEIREKEGLGPVEGGNVAYLQRQMVPIDKIGDVLEAEMKPPPPPVQAAPEQQPAPAAPDEPPKPDAEVARALVADQLTKKRKMAAL